MNASEVLNMIFKQLSVPPIGTNCYIFGDDATKMGAIVDPGGDAAGILAAVRDLGLTVSAIFLTHGHYDHVGALPELRKALPDVPVYLHPAEKAIRDGSLIPDPGPTVDYGDGSTVSVGGLTVEVIHTPGHTPGGVCLKVGDTLFTGDTLFRGSMGRTDFPGGSYDAIMDSLKRLAALPGDYKVCPGHEALSTLEAERKGNYYMREAVGQ